MIWTVDEVRLVHRMLDVNVESNSLSRYGKLVWIGSNELLVDAGWVWVRIRKGVGENFGFVQGRLFADFLGNVDGDLELNVCKNELVCKTDTWSFVFKKEEGERPNINHDCRGVELDVGVLDKLRKISWIVDLGQYYPVLRGVAIINDKILASDNVRLAKLSLDKDVGSSLVLHGEAVNRLLSCMSVLGECRKVVDLENRLYCGFDYVDMYLLKINETYPDLDKFFNETKDCMVSVEVTNEMKRTLEVLSEVFREGTQLIEIMILGNVIKMKVQNEYAVAERELSSGMDGMMSVRFKTFLRKLLEVVMVSNRMSVLTSDKLYFVSEDGAEFLLVRVE